MLDIKKRTKKLQDEKKAIESAVALINSNMQGLQQQLAEHNKNYLLIEGKLELLEELEQEEKDENATS